MDKEHIKQIAANLLADMSLLARHNNTTIVQFTAKMDGKGAVEIEMGNSSATHGFQFSEREVKRLSEQILDSEEEQINSGEANVEPPVSTAARATPTNHIQPANPDTIKQNVKQRG